MQRHLEDLDNHNHHSNICERGLPEASDSEDLKSVLQTLFDGILGDPSSQHIKLDRAHWALKPKGLQSRPRDVSCRVHSYSLKEDIMCKARTTKPILYEGTPVQLFPDLSWITLQKCRLLQPLLLSLCEAIIVVCHWGFTFSLSGTRDGKSAVLRVPQDLRTFCDILDVPIPELPGWGLIPPSSPSSGGVAGGLPQEKTASSRLSSQES